MIGRDLDFDLHNAIQDLIGEGLLEENASAHSVARLVIHDGLYRARFFGHKVGVKRQR
jgi:hypothetical protein